MATTGKLIVILAMPRSGTHFLRAAIAGSADIVNLDEPFNPDLGDRPYRFDRFLRGEIAADAGWRLDARNADAIVARYFERLRAEGNGRPVLIDIKENELRTLDWPATMSVGEPRVLRHILSAGYPVIHVVRRDLLAQYASVQRAMLTREWVRTGAGSALRPTLTLDYDLALRHMLMTAAVSLMVRHWLRPHPRVLSLAYETTIADDRLTDGARAALQDFLGRPVTEPKTGLPRKLAAPLGELVGNLAAIRARLAADGLDWACDLEAAADTGYRAFERWLAQIPPYPIPPAR